MIEVSIVNKNGQELYKCKDNSIDFIYQAQYDEGDKIIVNKKDTDHIAMQLDEYIAESIIYSGTNQIVFEVPFGELRRE